MVMTLGIPAPAPPAGPAAPPGGGGPARPGPIAAARAAAAAAQAVVPLRPDPAAEAALVERRRLSAARARRRHLMLALSFVVAVLLPLAAAGAYLWAVALDQYQSRLGFSVQREEMSSPVEILGGITELSGSSTSDTDVLYRFIRSREMVQAVHARLDLIGVYTRPEDPAFSLGPAPTIEDIEAHWNRKVDVYYDSASHLIEVRVLAFSAEEARAIGAAILDESARMLNRLTAIARTDATRYAREELALAQDRLKTARQALTAFRIRSQIVDPAADVQGRMGLLNNLLAQQAAALIDLDILAANTSRSDTRYTQAEKRVEVIEARIRAERARFGDQPAEEDARYADLVATFEALAVDLEFAQKAYLGALAAYDLAQAEAQRTSRYLATYLSPTRAERAEFPQRGLNLGLAALFLSAIWAVGALVYYALRDRR
jgi:capsular polysaccharide transport system permease protein